MTYVIQKKTKCECDPKTFTLQLFSTGDLAFRQRLQCPLCHGSGYTYEEVDLLDVLKRVEWTESVIEYDVDGFGYDISPVTVRSFGDDVRVKE